MEEEKKKYVSKNIMQYYKPSDNVLNNNTLFRVFAYIEKNKDYVLNHALNRFNYISKNAERDIKICEDWVTDPYPNIAGVARVYNLSYSNCNRIINTFVRNAYTIAYAKEFYESDSLLCYNISNAHISLLARKARIKTIKDLLDKTTGDIDNLEYKRCMVNGTKVPKGIIEDIKKNKDLYDLLNRNEGN